MSYIKQNDAVDIKLTGVYIEASEWFVKIQCSDGSIIELPKDVFEMRKVE